MSHYVYKYVYEDEIIYIGKSDVSVKSRIDGHKKENKFLPYLNNAKIYYCTLANAVMSDVVESELIRRYKPKLNVAKMSDWDGLDFPELKWEEYVEKKKKYSTKNDFCISNKYTFEQLLNDGESIVEGIRKKYGTSSGWFCLCKNPNEMIFFSRNTDGVSIQEYGDNEYITVSKGKMNQTFELNEDNICKFKDLYNKEEFYSYLFFHPPITNNDLEFDFKVKCIKIDEISKLEEENKQLNYQVSFYKSKLNERNNFYVYYESFASKVKNIGISYDEVLKKYKNNEYVDYISESYNKFGEVVCSKRIYTYLGGLYFDFYQINTTDRHGWIYDSVEDETIKNWNVFRSWINRGSNIYYPCTN